MNIIIKGALMNCGALTNQDFLSNLSLESNEFEYYTLDPPRGEGKVISACFDWALIGENLPDLLSLIWNAYKKLFPSSKDSNQGVVINIMGNNNQFIINSQTSSKEELIREVQADLHKNSWVEDYSKEESIRNSPNWKQIKI